MHTYVYIYIGFQWNCITLSSRLITHSSRDTCFCSFKPTNVPSGLVFFVVVILSHYCLVTATAFFLSLHHFLMHFFILIKKCKSALFWWICNLSIFQPFIQNKNLMQFSKSSSYTKYKILLMTRPYSSLWYTRRRRKCMCV